MAEEEIYNEALGAIQQGDNRRARDLLARLLKVNPEKVDYWIWMSSVVETKRERIYCLNEALKRDPNNATARRGLVILGAMAPDPGSLPPPGIIKREWQVELPKSPEEENIPKTPFSRLTLILSAVLVIGFVLVVVLVVVQLTAPPVVTPTFIAYRPSPPTPGPSPTSLDTFTPVVRSPTPTFVGPTPLRMLMQATYTPTPLYVDTPHPQIEAYRAAMTDFSRGNFNTAIDFFGQVLQSQPDAVDAVYYIGECYRLQGKYANALDYYNQAITMQPSFAPAYLGRARANFARNTDTDVMPDLKKAASLDPDMGEIYIEEARAAIAAKDYSGALDYLATAAKKLPDSAEVPYYRAEAYLALNQLGNALTAATQANELDFTSLPAYRLLGEVLQANERYSESIQPLALYLIYKTRDEGAWIMLGKGYAAEQDWKQAKSAFDHAVSINSSSTDAYLARGDMYLAAGDGVDAASDFNQVLKLDARSFTASIGLGRAYMLQSLYSDAYNQFRQAERFAADDADHAELYYWLALALNALDQPAAAGQEWENLLQLPTDVVPTDWIGQALVYLTGTPTPLATETPAPLLTGTPSLSVTGTPAP